MKQYLHRGWGHRGAQTAKVAATAAAAAFALLAPASQVSDQWTFCFLPFPSSYSHSLNFFCCSFFLHCHTAGHFSLSLSLSLSFSLFLSGSVPPPCLRRSRCLLFSVQQTPTKAAATSVACAASAAAAAALFLRAPLFLPLGCSGRLQQSLKKEHL